MTPLVNHFVSGRAFFSGGVLILVALGMQVCFRSRLKYLAAIIAGCGIALVTLSATPLSIWLYAAWAIIVVTGMTARRHRAASVVAILVTCITMAWQLLYYLPPHLPSRSDDTFYLIGDSLSAGIGTPNVICWPQLVRQRYHVNVVDLARGGATVQSSLERARTIRADDHLVLLEIGGNDMLHKTPISEFITSLETLLQTVCHPGRIVVMLEIPLPPFDNNYGLVQRRLAKQFGVVLIPRRFFADALTGKEATLDGIHLSQQGHESFAKMIARFISPGFATVH